jgi:hypothetical protein
MAILAELQTDVRAAVAAGDWDTVARLAMSPSPGLAESTETAIDEYRRELEAILGVARGRRREMKAALARVRAANGFNRQSFGASPGF